MVDLMGLLSNPANWPDLSALDEEPSRPTSAARRPVQVHRRLPARQVDELVERYEAGASINALADTFRINRTTVMSHLDRREVPRRHTLRLLDDQAVATAAERHADGISLMSIARELHVSERTLRREFQKAGVQTRLRPGLRTT